jgi:hypothetical protein
MGVLLGPVFEAIVSIILGQLPSALVLLTGEPSLYQPGIYYGLKPFLVVPLMVGVVATWSVIHWKPAMWTNFGVFTVLAVIIFYIYKTQPPSHWLHPVNWILSYSAFALLIAAFMRFVFDTIKSWRIG